MRLTAYFVSAAAVALAAALPAHAQSSFSASTGASGGGPCAGDGVRQGTSPVTSATLCSGGAGVAASDAVSSFGHVGVSADTASTSSLPASSFASARFTDNLFFTDPDPTVHTADVSVNLLIEGALLAAGGFNSGSDAEISGYAQIGASLFLFDVFRSSDGSVTTTNPFFTTAGVLGGPSASLTSPFAPVSLTAPTTFVLEFDARSESGGPSASARADFANTFRLATDGDAFNLPDGVTVNAGNWLVDNRFIDSLAAPAGVPEPASWALMIAGFGLMGATLRRRAAAAA
jgi:hypothetical protein